MSWRPVVRVAGKTLVGGGIVVLLFIVYQLWGTTLFESHSQSLLRQRFDAGQTTSTTDAATSPRSPGTSKGAAKTGDSSLQSQNLANAGPPPPEGAAVAILQIPSIDLDKAVVQGVADSDLSEGPGHYPETPLPGQHGNAAIAGHRTTFGGPFFRLNDLKPGDEILVTTHQGSFRYVVFQSVSVSPFDIAYVAPSNQNLLTLTTCTPPFSAAERLVVQSRLVGPAAAGESWVTSLSGGGNDVLATTSSAAAILAGGAGRAWPGVVGWGLADAAAAVALWAVALSRRRRWAVWLVGTPVLLVGLFFVFEHVNALLPANL